MSSKWVPTKLRTSVVELAVSHHSVHGLYDYLSQYLNSPRKPSPNLRFRPQHWYIEQNPFLIKSLGRLVHPWTMRFEGKQMALKQILHDTHNYKTVLKILAESHPEMTACHLSSQTCFKPTAQTWTMETALNHFLLMHIQLCEESQTAAVQVNSTHLHYFNIIGCDLYGGSTSDIKLQDWKWVPLRLW